MELPTHSTAKDPRASTVAAQVERLRQSRMASKSKQQWEQIYQTLFQLGGTCWALWTAYSQSDKAGYTNPNRTLCGIIIFVPSTLVWLWARLLLAEAGSFSVMPWSEAPPKLVTTGPYSLFSHPVYLFSWLQGLGMLLIVGSGWGLLILVLFGVPVQLYRARSEDGKLRLKFKGYWENWRKDLWF